MILFLLQEARSLDWFEMLKLLIATLTGGVGVELFRYLTTKKQADAGTNQILNNMVQVTSGDLQEWMKAALESAKTIVELRSQIGTKDILNGKLTARIEDLEDFINRTLDLVRDSNVKNFDEFEKEVHEILDEAV